ncbi:hypothetical protein G5C51_16705 [Streptomyces sp. A7024]|uniref:Lipoprotein n=1 Tax=Streptomyces coryli TaxID=1128680 RepID=A0A6G4U2S2_9ACTN|nr:hypothetical protein [Streptomyces coryli]NGN65531.1 hypothetical protein [Streptomyces coryli]
MIRRTRTVRTAAAAVAALPLLAACGEEVAGRDKPPVAEVSPSGPAADCGGDPRGYGKPHNRSSAKPTDPPLGPDSHKRGAPPSTSASLPRSVQMRFADWEAEDKAEQQVLDAAAQAERQTYSLALDDHPGEDAPPVQPDFDEYYAKGSAAWKCRKSYAEQFQSRLALSGTARFYDPRVTVADDGAHASLAYCADLNVFEASQETNGHVRYALAEPGTYPRLTTKLRKGEEGDWQTTEARTEPGGCSKSGHP